MFGRLVSSYTSGLRAEGREFDSLSYYISFGETLKKYLQVECMVMKQLLKGAGGRQSDQIYNKSFLRSLVKNTSTNQPTFNIQSNSLLLFHSMIGC